MSELEHQVVVASQGSTGQDRAAVFTRGHQLVAVIADGAGGTSGGAEAASLVLDHVRRVVESDVVLKSRTLWRQTLLEASIALEAVGQTTAVIIGGGYGASVGDSGAWLIRENERVDLTEGQRRKPLLGGGLAEPAAFKVSLDYGETLLLATDGLLKYVKPDRICELARRSKLDGQALVDAARLPGGALQDDVAVILIRKTYAVRAKRLREAAASGDARDLDTAVERWLEATVPREHNFGFDGANVTQREPQRLAGVCWRLDTHGLCPFELRLEPDHIELFYGDAERPGGFNADAKRLTTGLPREWLVHVRVATR